MNFDALLKVGESLAKEYIVKPENTADFIGNKGVTTLSTPSMIGFMEDTATHVVIDYMPENYRPVGTKINVEHINPTPVNMNVTIKATLIAIEGSKLRYNVEAFNEEYKIGFGIYEQHVINLGDFLSKN
ncbi:dihydrolipoamide acyltransferase [Clostridium estertheticum]|uniref:thioesterase family protein n=1 Tax=Clostridium estertheticum TaxID=238834 RepID=UPI0013E9182C|nr:hotdog domain-containing protein [Clostridium estertheticum]MBZ9689606.1 dihydrolipoamide acyltransferase [Clostridium estertheticum]